MVLYQDEILIISLYVIIFPGRNFLMQIESPCLWLHHSDCVAFISLIWLVLCCSYCASVYSNFNIIYTQLGKSFTTLLQFSCLGFVLLRAFCILCTLSCKLSICIQDVTRMQQWSVYICLKLAFNTYPTSSCQQMFATDFKKVPVNLVLHFNKTSSFVVCRHSMCNCYQTANGDCV